MEIIEFELKKNQEFIPLIQLLKAVNLAGSGSEAQECVTAGLVKRNNETEYRKRAKIRSGEVIRFDRYEIRIR